MMSEKDYFDKVDWFREKFGGEPMTNDQIVSAFAMHGQEHRVAILHQIESDQSEITDLRKAARTQSLKRKLNSVHQMQLKVDR
jgi:hypothetical protein